MTQQKRRLVARGARKAASRTAGRGIKPNTKARRQALVASPPRSQTRGPVESDARGEARRMRTILSRLERAYPDSRCSLRHKTPLQLLMATILSAQCTDERVNLVTPQLFGRYPDAESLASADQEEVEEIIRSTGFYRNKARNIIHCARELMTQYGGEVPQDLESLVKLPGIGRKTANVVLGNAFGIPGLVVDTHVTRIARLLNLTREKDAVKIEHDLMKITPKVKWTNLAHLFIDHGRKVCIARRPQCAACVLNDLCPSSSV